MKTRTLLLTLTALALGQSVYAARWPAVETRGMYLKVIDGDKGASAQPENDPPDILYVRKDTIASVSVIFSSRSGEYRVILVTNGPSTVFREDTDKVVLSPNAKSYAYRFSTQSSAEAFCEALVAAK